MGSWIGGFVHPALLAGLGLATVPILIHLLNRQRHKPVPWAAMRFVLAAADEETYGRVVAALASCRDSVTRRIVVSYLLPGEREWVADCLADVAQADQTLRAMLLCSVGSPEQLAPFGNRPHIGWNERPARRVPGFCDVPRYFIRRLSTWNVDASGR